MLSFRSFLLLLFLSIPLFIYSQDTTFNADSVYKSIEHLSITIGPRPMGSANEQEAIKWAEQKFSLFGADTSYILPFSKFKKTNTNSGIAVGVFKGQTDSAIVIGGHIDSADPETPGACDNASGSASTIELARIWSKRERHYTMIFTTFGGEEQGLYGSHYFADNDRHMKDVILMVSLDMTGADDDILPMFEIKNFQSPIWLYRDAFALDRELGINRLHYPTHFSTINNLSSGGPGSDHIPFLEKGIPAIDFTAGVENSPIHTHQDNIENIDKQMLATCGLLADKLLLNYQSNGIPPSNPESYFVWQFAGEVFFFPLWLIVVFNLIALLTGIGAFIFIFRQRLVQEKTQRVKFSAFKLFLLFIVVAIFSQFGEALIQFIRGYRYPWLMHIDAYLFYAALWALTGCWMVLQFSRRWRFSPDPFTYASRGLILLSMLVVPFLLIDMRLALYPALSLMLFSLAILLPQPWLKTALVLLSPIPFTRLMFTEVFNAFPGRISTYTGFFLDSWLKSFLYAFFLTLLIVLWYLPFIYIFTYQIVSADHIRNWIKQFRKPVGGVIVAIAVLGFSIYLLTLPVYNDTWRPLVSLKAEYDIRKEESKLTLSGNEYFKDVFVKTESTEMLYTGRSHKEILPVPYQANWFKISGEKQIHSDIDSTLRLHWQIISEHPWLSLNLILRSDTSIFSRFQSDLAHKYKDDKVEFRWHAFPPDTVNWAAEMMITPGSNIIREIIAEYMDMPVPVIVTSELANVKYRTVVTYRDTLDFSSVLLNQNK